MLRWARGLGAALGVILLFALWMLGGAAWITARPADPMLWPARDAQIVEVTIVSNGYHAGVALPLAALAEFASGRGYPALIAVTLVDTFEVMLLPRRVRHAYRPARLYYRAAWFCWRVSRGSASRTRCGSWPVPRGTARRSSWLGAV